MGAYAKNNENKNQNLSKKSDEKNAKQKIVTKPKDAEKKLTSKATEQAAKPTGPFSDGSKLQVLLDNGWVDQPSEMQQAIGIQLAADTKKFAVPAADGTMYILDFSNPDACTQTNAASKKTRQIRIVKP